MKSNWKVALIALGGVVAVALMCVFGVYSSQNKAIAMEEQVKTAQSDIKVQEKRRVDLVYNLADCVKQYDSHEAETTLKRRLFLLFSQDFCIFVATYGHYTNRTTIQGRHARMSRPV